MGAIICGIITLSIPILSYFNNNITTAVMLPYIDSANHNSNANSIIEYNPINNCFVLNIGNKCLDVNNQLFITYGIKNDDELLINYGFLPGVFSNNDNDDNRDGIRKKLADEY